MSISDKQVILHRMLRFTEMYSARFHQSAQLQQAFCVVVSIVYVLASCHGKMSGEN